MALWVLCNGESSSYSNPPPDKTMFIVPFLLGAVLAVLLGFTSITVDPHGVSFHVTTSTAAKARIQELEQELQESWSWIEELGQDLEESWSWVDALEAKATAKTSELQQWEQKYKKADAVSAILAPMVLVLLFCLAAMALKPCN